MSAAFYKCEVSLMIKWIEIFFSAAASTKIIKCIQGRTLHILKKKCILNSGLWSKEKNKKYTALPHVLQII